MEFFAGLTRSLLDADTVADALHLLVAAAGRVPGSDLVSVTLRRPVLRTPVSSHETATELDEVQYHSGHGPCVDASGLDTGYVVSEDLRVETRWPEFSEAASKHGVGSVLSATLPASDGALNIYSRDPGGPDRNAAMLLAAHGALALSRAHTVELAGRERGQLLRALENRDVIGQAKGILMARDGLTAGEAFDVLRRTSQARNIKVVDLARTITARHDALGEL